MGHQSDDATKALRAYAGDLRTTATRGGVVSPVGISKQDDASAQSPGSGAPHQLAIAAVVVCVVLLGGIGVASATIAAPAAKDQHSIPLSAQPESVAVVLSRAGGVSAIQAVQAFNDLGMTRAVDALNAAAGTGTDSSPAVQDALEALIGVVREKLTDHGYVSETDLDVALAINAVDSAVRRPPGLDPQWLAPGLGGTPPPQLSLWIAPGRDEPFVGPGQDPLWIPPGLVDNEHPGLVFGENRGQNRNDNEGGGGKP